ncbi:MAG: EAL domain-containing protein [Rhodospirillaceae bacterium]|jgi:PAS domain S-box-containing protein|nr:EAL domain-containing protein [Rhodospirillaceae bacterium]MBT5373812.1 EAL domain-containing protein [Rhodospirillaceae bacterium]MBT5659751.1 EAL domain-containing protein [Rhodospirillaceae bacterium]MBT5752445.1 EAL domain-containing protein [Rhodospirillaceae bacterium]
MVKHRAKDDKEESQIAALRAERDRFVAFAFCAVDILFELDSSFQITFVRGETEALIGLTPDELLGRTIVGIIDEADRDRLVALIQRASAGMRVEMHDLHFPSPDGVSPALSLIGYYLPDLRGRYFIGMRLGAYPPRIACQEGIVRDTESGLFDTETFAGLSAERLREAIEIDTDFKLTLFDLEDLAKFRRRLDPKVRSVLLTQIGELLLNNSLDGDSAGRFSGEQYGLIHEAALDVEDLRDKISDLARYAGTRREGVSVESVTMDLNQKGLAPADSAKALTYTLEKFRSQKSDVLSIDSLKDGFEAVMAETSMRITGARNIVASQAFDIAFQPIVDLDTLKIHHFEALARLNHGGGHESPFEFIRFAEEVGIINDFDLAMCKRVMGWIDKNSKAGKDYSVAINLSGKSMTNQAFVDDLVELTKIHHSLKGQILFELTESASIDNLETVNNVIQGLRQNGMRFCLDDFGSGEAAFHYLRAMDVDMVKIDGIYVREALTTTKDQYFLRAISGLANDLNIDTVAEMVEDENTVGLIRDCGVRFGQGYFFGRPSLDINEFVSGEKESSEIDSAKPWLRLVKEN